MPAVASALLTPPMDPVPFTFGDERARPSPRLIAEQTAEMICYLWFSTTLARPLVHTKTRSGGSAGSGGGGGGSLKRRQHHPPSSPQDPARMALQFQPSTTFVDFLLKILETTQVSQSVIVLSLHYIYRLKEHNALTYGQAGSELRVAVVALMLANKFVDDNTYTNKTWSDVSSIDLSEVNKMEREFLHGIEYMLFVDEETYLSWLNLLKGLVAAKDKDFRSWQQQQTRMQRRDRELAAAHIRPRVATPRARSSSPTPSARPASFPFTFAVPAEPNPFQYQQPASYSQPPHQQSSPPSSSYSYVPPYTSPAHISPVRKRPAEAAFSPATYASHVPLKRPVSMDMSGVSAHTRSSDAFTH
ncbi:hypothetical protein EXIGLDRAFT_365065 [Exidia glandulosa HHB12029]|uniref:Cyclin-like domain-containing protein n=1 Tax=Exidia glandulosa HHB12029 TaxID=1314781 RepID=A0A165C424_EXIGL|nr:hypothetical protein EXIGLDRAFT_365065 [Exidia glandulosa HHB12029]